MKLKTTSVLTVMLPLVLLSCSSKKTQNEAVTLQEAFKGKFVIGAALNTNQIAGQNPEDLELVKKQFNTIVAENCMKHEQIHPEKDRYTFDEADALVAFGEENNMFVVGHTLVWHSQTAPWVFKDTEGKTVSRDTLIARMKDHIYTVVGRYKGRVHGWDVVNEAINDEGGLRSSPWLDIIGDDFLELAFKFAHEADPEAELYYNDYNLYQAGKRADVVALVKGLKEAGCQVDGIGMQGHYGLTSPSMEELEESIIAFAKLGCKVMVTELDVTVIPFPSEELTAEVSTKYANSPEFNPYPEALPDSMQQALSDRYAELFGVYLKHQDKISRVTFWGLNNGHSWRNNWPINGRTDYPLLFDRNNKMVPAGKAIMELVKQ